MKIVLSSNEVKLAVIELLNRRGLSVNNLAEINVFNEDAKNKSYITDPLSFHIEVDL